MRILKNVVLVTLTIALISVGVYFYSNLTDGFSSRKLLSKLPYNPCFEVEALNPVEKARLSNILDQPFYYIGKGCQFYVFGSKDDKYVIKFLKQKHLRLHTELNNVPMPKFLRTKANAKIARRIKRVNNLFLSCKLAYEELAEESGLEFIHLNHTPVFNKRVILFDKRGAKNAINIDNYEFIIQKKALVAKKVFAQLTNDELEDHVNQLIDLVNKRCIKGIGDRDRAFLQNVAFSQDGLHAMFTDIGQFYKDRSVSLEEQKQEDIQKRLGNLRDWVANNNPDLLDHLDAILNQ